LIYRLSRPPADIARSSRPTIAAEQRFHPIAAGSMRSWPLLLSLLLPLVQSYALQIYARPATTSGHGRVAPLQMALPAPGTALPLPPSLASIDGVPSTYTSLEEFSGGDELLALIVSAEGAMTDPLRQTVVGLHGADLPGCTVAAVSMVPSAAYRKLARKASVDFPLFSDPGREWLTPLGAPADGAISVVLVSTASRTVLARFSDKPQAVVAAVAAAVAKGAATLDAEVSAAIARASAAADAKAAAEAEEAAKAAAAAAEAQAAADAAAAAKLAEKQKAQAELDELNARMQAKLEAEALAKLSGKKGKKGKKGAAKADAAGGAAPAKLTKAQKLKAAQAAQKAAKAEKAAPVITTTKQKTVPAAVDSAVAAAKATPATAAAATAVRPPPASSKPPSASPSAPAYDVSLIRNFCIIAHIDHGKSTLADRLLQTTDTVAERNMQAQLLDNMDIERERGITIKLQAARMEYTAKDGKTYILNLIDTPGHVDFQYEVSRSLAACEGALLVVDSSQGVEAQTIANAYLALDNDLATVPVLNKIDLPGADVDRVAEEVENTLGLDCSDAIPASAKVGIGVSEILEAIVTRMPPPADRIDQPLRALIFDSYWDPYRGVVVFIRVVDGELRRGDKILFSATGVSHEVLEVGTLTPGGERPTDVLRAGEVGYVLGGIKAIADARVGDTIVLKPSAKGSVPEALPGYREPVPMVYCGLFPVETTQYQLLRESLERLCLNDAAIRFEPETSTAMGFGFRCGFLGLLHAEIVQERLEREYDLDLIVTAPTVQYQVVQNDGSTVFIDSPAKLPDPDGRQSVSEPYVQLEMFCPKEYSGTLMELAQKRRGEYVDLKFLTDQRCSVKYATCTCCSPFSSPQFTSPPHHPLLTPFARLRLLAGTTCRSPR